MPRSRETDADLDFASARFAAEVKRPPIFAQALVVGSLLFLVVAVLWANWAVLDEVTMAEGRVIPSSQVQVIQNLEGGIVKSIEVHEGESVQAGQVLLSIDNSAFFANYGELKAKYHGLLAAVSRLEAEARQRPLAFPPELLAENLEAAERAKSLYMARQSELQGQLSVIEQQVQQRQQELASLRSRKSSLERGVNLLREELKITEPLVKEGVVPRIEFIRLRRQLNEKVSELDGVTIGIEQAEAALREANRRIEERFLTFRAEAQKELTDRETELATTREAITAAKDRVLRTEVRSPVRGIVKRIKVSTIGGVVRPGMDLVEVVPIDDTLLVEAKVRPQDIAFIRPDQDAIVKITAYDYSIYGGLKAKVERISADTISETNEAGRTETYYEIVVRTEKNFLGPPEAPLPIIPGMVASVDILTGKKSVLDYLLKPVLQARDRALRER